MKNTNVIVGILLFAMAIVIGMFIEKFKNRDALKAEYYLEIVDDSTIRVQPVDYLDSIYTCDVYDLDSILILDNL